MSFITIFNININSVDFVHLQCQSEYSVKNSLSSQCLILIDSVLKKLGMKSVALDGRHEPFFCD